MYIPPPPRLPSHPPPPRFRPPSSSSSNNHFSPHYNRPPPGYICRRCDLGGQHFLRDCPLLSDHERRERQERWENEKRFPQVHNPNHPYQNPRASHGQGGGGFERNGGLGGGAVVARGAGGIGGYQGTQQRGEVRGPSHHRAASNSSNVPNPNFIPPNPNPNHHPHPRRPTDPSPAPSTSFRFVPADCWTPGKDGIDPELEHARRSREKRKEEEASSGRRSNREREQSRSRRDEHDQEVDGRRRESSSPSKRSLKKERAKERAEERAEVEKERGMKRERRDSGYEEGTSSRKRVNRSRDSSREPDRDLGRRPAIQPSNQVRPGRVDSVSNGKPDHLPRKNRHARSPHSSPAPRQHHYHEDSPYGPPRPLSPPRPLLSRIDRAEELIQDKSQVQKNTEESSEATGAYTGPGWSLPFSHYNEKIELRQRSGTETNGGRQFRIPGNDARSLPYEMIQKIDPLLNVHHQRDHDVQHFNTWPTGPSDGTNVPYRPWLPPGAGQVIQAAPYRTNINPRNQGYAIEYPSGKSSYLLASAPRSIPPFETNRSLSKPDSYAFPYRDNESDGLEEGEVHSSGSRASSDVGSSVSRRRRNSAASSEAKEEQEQGREPWRSLSICRSDKHEDEDDDRGQRRGTDDSRSDRSMASQSPSPRRDRDGSESPLRRRSPRNALGIDLRPHSNSLPPLGRVHTPNHEALPARPSSRLQSHFPPISPQTLATLLPESIPVRRLMLEVARPRRLPSSRALCALASSDPIQPGTVTPTVSPRFPSCTLTDQGFKATLPDENGKRRLLFVGGTGAGESFWEGGDFGPRPKSEDAEEQAGAQIFQVERQEVVEEKKLVGLGGDATSSSATVVPRPSTSHRHSPLPPHPYRHSTSPSLPSSFQPALGGGSIGATSKASATRGTGGRTWPTRPQTQTPSNSTSSLHPHPPPPLFTSANDEGRGGLPPSSDLDSFPNPNYNRSPEELRARVVLSLKRQKDSPKKPQPLKSNPSIIIQTTSAVPPNSSLGLFNDDNDASATSPQAPTLIVDADSIPTTATTSSNTTLLTLPNNLRLEILKHLPDKQQSSFQEMCEEWSAVVEGSKKVAVDQAPSEPENSAGQESEEAEAEAEDGEIDEMGAGMKMEGVEELGKGGGGGEGGGLDKQRFKPSFMSIASSGPTSPAQLVCEVEEGVGMRIEEVVG